MPPGTPDSRVGFAPGGYTVVLLGEPGSSVTAMIDQ